MKQPQYCLILADRPQASGNLLFGLHFTKGQSQPVSLTTLRRYEGQPAKYRIVCAECLTEVGHAEACSWRDV